MRGLLLAFLLLLPASALGARSHALVRAELAPDLATIRGTVDAHVHNAGEEPLRELVLWLYPELFARELPGVNDVNRSLYRPWPGGKGGVDVRGVKIAGAKVAPRDGEVEGAPAGTARLLRLPAPLRPGESVRIELEFVTRVPHRLGPLARAKGVLTSLGGWHPWVAAPGDAPLDNRPAAADWQVELALPPDHLALVGGVPTRGEPVVLRDREWVDLAVRPAALRPLRARGGRVWPLENPAGERWEKGAQPDPPRLPTAFVADDLVELLSRMDRWADAQAELPPLASAELVVVPLRSEIALATPGMIAVSDRAFQVTPLETLKRFHALGVARAYFARRVLPLVRGCEEPALVPQVADALGAFWAGRFLAAELGRTADARALLGAFDFLPTVDDFLRSPKSPFPHVFFLPVAEPIAVRDEPWFFSNEAPRGKLLLEKLRDRVGDEALAAAILDYGERCPLRAALEAEPGELEGFFDAWTRTFPREDLRIAVREVVRLPGGRHRSWVGVRRLGDAPPERIEADVWDEAGRLHRLVWNADEGDREELFAVESGAPVVRARVDPRGRVVQTPHERGEIAALGDRVPTRLQVVLTRFAISYSTADQALFGDVDVMLRPREVVHRRLSLGASWRQARVGGRASLLHGFGPLVDAARYAWNVGGGITGDYLRAGFGGEDVQAGFAVGPFAAISYDDRPPAFDPLRGTAFSAYASFAAGANRGGVAAVFGSVNAAATRLFHLGGNHALALRLKASSVLGDAPLQQLWSVGGSDDALRGFPLQEVLAERRGIASAEWRHPLLTDLDVDLYVVRLRQLTGAAFVDGAVADAIFPLFPDTPDRAAFADVGYGLRFQYDLAGVRPLFFAVDAALPIGRFESVTGAAPITFSVRAGQAFASP